ncbi:MAG: Ig-like domain-containing protein [Gemmatimonadota bacterium]|nr:Ig-like domain-containing protein [Gemmatimonadota bacterium]
MSLSKSKCRRPVYCLLAALIAACGGSGDPAPTSPSGVNSVDVTPAAPTIGVDGTVQLSAIPLDASGSALAGQNIAWRSTEPAVATVDGSGMVHGLTAGAASITATVDGTIGISTILVRAAAASIAVTPTAPTVLVGRTVQLVADVRDAAHNPLVGATVTWSSSDTHTATVAASGLVTGIAHGTATITAVSDSRSATSLVTVNPSADLLRSQLSGGLFQNCSIDAAGTGHCWGINLNGSLGNGTGIPGSDVPVTVAGGLTFRAIDTGDGISCAITTAGKSYCWGDNSTGQLGDGTISNSNVPVPVVNGDDFVTLTSGQLVACGLTTGGKAYCWGNNMNGRIGDGTTTNRTVPTAVSGALSFANISTHGVTCGVTFDHLGYCWGTQSHGELGGGTTSSTQKTPTRVSGSVSFRMIKVGSASACGLSTSGAAYCWGDGTNGQLGNGATTTSNVPVAVSGGLTFTDLEVGSTNVCALTAAGVAYCWGINSSGDVGDGTTTRRLVPTAVSGGITFAEITAGLGTGCGRSTAGSVYCWGLNTVGQLGNGTKTSSSVPVRTSGANPSIVH